MTAAPHPEGKSLLEGTHWYMSQSAANDMHTLQSRWRLDAVPSEVCLTEATIVPAVRWQDDAAKLAERSRRLGV
jgi:hypothetical protein